MPHCNSFLGKWFLNFLFSVFSENFEPIELNFQCDVQNASMKNLSLEFSGFSKKFSGPHEKLKKKLFFDSFESLLQNLLGGILRRSGPKNGQNATHVRLNKNKNKNKNLRLKFKFK